MPSRKPRKKCTARRVTPKRRASWSHVKPLSRRSSAVASSGESTAPSTAAPAEICSDPLASQRDASPAKLLSADVPNPAANMTPTTMGVSKVRVRNAPAADVEPSTRRTRACVPRGSSHGSIEGAPGARGFAELIETEHALAVEREQVTEAEHRDGDMPFVRAVLGAAFAAFSVGCAGSSSNGFVDGGLDGASNASTADGSTEAGADLPQPGGARRLTLRGATAASKNSGAQCPKRRPRG